MKAAPPGFLPTSVYCLLPTCYPSPVRRAGADGHLAAAQQFEVSAALDVDGAGARTRADDGADGRALAAARDGADDGADRRADGRALRGLRAAAVVVTHRALVVHLHRLAALRADAVDEARELVG